MDEGIAAGVRARQLALLLGIGLTTLQRWRRQFAGEGGGIRCAAPRANRADPPSASKVVTPVN